MIFLIDYENTDERGLNGIQYIEGGDQVFLFYSKSCPKIRRKYLESLEASGCRFEAVRLLRTGKNGLDFYIAIKVEELRGAGCKEPINIISQDHGYQAVIDYYAHVAPVKHHVYCHKDILSAVKNAPEGAKRGVHENERKVDILTWCQGRAAQAGPGTDVEAILGSSHTRREAYLACLKAFGQAEGLKVYRERVRGKIA